MGRTFLRRGLTALWVAVVAVGLAGPAGAAIVTEEFMISSPGDVKLYLRNKHPEALYDIKSDKTVLFLHGASYPAHSSFDHGFEGRSWMDWLAAKGYDVYSLDIRGYGKSTRPKAMAEAPEANPPVVDTEQALQDVSAAVDFILSRRNSQKLVLVGWSWGATLAGSFATSQSGRVERLVLYAPQWLREVVPPTEEEMARVPAWRSVDPRNARDVWLKAVPEDRRASVLSKPAFDAWMAATLASDPQPAAGGTVRAPNGVVLDTMRYWASGKPRWNPARVTVPTLVIQGEWDAEAPPAMGMQVFNTLSHNIFKRYVMVGGTTHAALLESNRHQLYRAVQEFLETPLQ
ncbi:alpha/beta hydrolase [Magnetospirillum sp. SS-4]|uniref:alpha/beta hydrolase n=1 Tax=Magnetospirillum sp. SS-4 TaxID=2681465 RepID=UPI0020C2577D|nr:alpha/beta fold hydrolase [Magnetospirillum sp. SS-4]